MNKVKLEKVWYKYPEQLPQDNGAFYDVYWHWSDETKEFISQALWDGDNNYWCELNDYEEIDDFENPRNLKGEDYKRIVVAFSKQIFPKF